ncbi:hypothetical protein BS47DRAFT_1359844 [Hydnum rufescens UP504]|uniref:Phosphoglycerate mutase-like protein n=1 Tax=Hydnum rufescens UP504 TaxID=1448309 RepID=A0A9P6B4B5_9AGAM|nr:hypothetical protein BS47DRAFT_1359844 [Hydnum rufescens UP504]
MLAGFLPVALAALHLACPAVGGPALKPTKTFAGNTAAFPPPGVPIDHSLFPPGEVLGLKGRPLVGIFSAASIQLSGDEAFAVQTAPAYAYNHDFVPLIQPDVEKSRRKHRFPGDIDLCKATMKKSRGRKRSHSTQCDHGEISHLGSPPRSGWTEASPLIPGHCALTQVHMVHRHGARYPTGGEGPSLFASKLHDAAQTGKLRFTKDLAFLNSWTYKLGEELLTPFGRKQMFDLGVCKSVMLFGLSAVVYLCFSMNSYLLAAIPGPSSNYGNLLKNFTDKETFPVFRSETHDRMVKSALNFAAGFFGIPYEDQYQLSLIVEAFGFNNTFAPYYTCKNGFKAMGPNSPTARLSKAWIKKYLVNARKRLQSQASALIFGMDLTITDTHAMQELCAYETVALGYSAFCPLFTEEEWYGFQYAFDLSFWYTYGFGSPTAAAQGAGYANELLHRLKRILPSENPFSVNQTLDGNKITFPLDQSIYVDATHEVTLVNILTALDFKSLARSGPLPEDHIVRHRSFLTSHIAPFGTNLVIQVVDCAETGRSIRFFLNDGALPIGIKGCPKNKDGFCPLDVFIRGLQERLDSIDWEYDCLADYQFTDDITDGRAPR